jgi:hypothetical protein
MTAENEADDATVGYVGNQLTVVIDSFTLVERATLLFIVLIGGYADMQSLLLLMVTYGLARRALAFYGKMTWDARKQTSPRAIRRFLLHTLEGWTPLPTDAFLCYYMGYAEATRKALPLVLKRLADEEDAEAKLRTGTPHS